MLVVAVTALSLAGLAGPAVASAAPQPVSTVFAWIDRTQLPVDATPPPVPVDLPGGSGVTALSVGGLQTLALTSGGQVLTWGGQELSSLNSGTTPVPVDLPAGIRITAVAAGADQSLALTSDGRVLSWGGNTYGQLGNGTFTNGGPPSVTPGPVLLSPRTRVTAIAAGGGFNGAGGFSLALTAAGRVLAWGANGNGELGNGSTANSDTPVPVDFDLPAGTRITAIAAGDNYALALTSDCRVLAWGENVDNQLGDNSVRNSLVPVPVDLPAGVSVTGITAAFRHAMALASDGRLLGWGSNILGQVGDGTAGNNHGRPVWVKLPAGTRVTAFAAGYAFGLAATSDGRLLAWGDHVPGRSLGPVEFGLPPGSHVTAIAASGSYALVLTARTATASAGGPAAGPALAWGDNTAGQLGDGSTGSSTVATRVHLPAGTQATAVAAASDHSLAVTSDGRVLSWGGDFFRELGYDRPTSYRDPYAHPTPDEMDIPAGTAVTAVAAGFSQSLALTSDRRALATGGPPACGDLFCSVLPTPVALPAGIRVTAVAAGDNFGLTLSADGRVLSWGFTGFGLMGVAGDSAEYGPGWVTLPARTRVTAVAAGGEHWLALTSAGYILAWGDNSSGDLGNGTTVSTDETHGTPMPAVAALPAGTRVTAIAAGTDDSLALTADGRVFAWGSNSFGQLGDGSLSSSLAPVPVDLPAGTRVVAIAAGDHHNLALTSDGRLLAWGYNAWGQLGDGSTADSSVPVPVELAAGTRVTAIAAGGDHSLALTASQLRNVAWR